MKKLPIFETKLIPRRSKEERRQKAIASFNRIIKSYKEGDLNLAGMPDISLPSNMIIHGDLDLTDSELKLLPDDLTVMGDLILTRSAIGNIPTRLFVAEDVYASDIWINQYDSEKDFKDDIQDLGGLIRGNVHLNIFL